MAKRNNRIDTEVVALSAMGLSQREIAKKLAVSKTTVSKILNEQKSVQKLANAKKKTAEQEEKENKSNRQKAHGVIDQIIDGLQEDIKKGSLKEKRETLKTLVELFGLPEEKHSETETETPSGDLYNALINREIKGFNDEQDEV